MELLVVEDDARIAHLVERALIEAGHQVDTTGDGATGLAWGASGTYDLIVLDILLPGMDGFAVCRRLRQRGVRTPILMLTARDAVADRVRGLGAGADDYLVKPFALDELLARVRAFERRVANGSDEVLHVGDLVLDTGRQEARRGGQTIALTAQECRLLAYLMRAPGRVLTEEQIMDAIWGYDSDATSNVVEVYIHYLREKIDQRFPRPLIRTVRGVGYTIKE